MIRIVWFNARKPHRRGTPGTDRVLDFLKCLLNTGTLHVRSHSLDACRIFARQHRELIARRADVGEKVDAVSNGMRLATDQARHAATTLTIDERCRRGFIFDVDLFHDVDGTAHARAVNSVSLQPAFVMR